MSIIVSATRKHFPAKGDRFGKRVIQGEDQSRHDGVLRVIVLCDCGHIGSAQYHSLLIGRCHSCRRCQPRRIKHGASGGTQRKMTPEYAIWRAMKQRCLNPDCAEYPGYGGRGISVCDEWMEYAGFIRDMGPRPSKEYSLERQKNDEGYSKKNCVWETRDAQVNNTRRNHRLTHDGETLTMAQWSKRTGLPKDVIFHRITRAGWATDVALTTPVADHERSISFEGKTQSVTDWAREIGVRPTILFGRLRRGWSVERALKTPHKERGAH